MTLFSFTNEIINKAESFAFHGKPLPEILTTLRKLSLEDFGLLMISMPNETYPHLSKVLPRMAPEDVQLGMTGATGVTLFAQTAAFARVVETAIARHTNRTIKGATILDLGVGYGRNIRSMLYFTNPDNLWGLDPWPQALEHSTKAGVPGHLVLSEPIPVDLPVDGTRFDLAISFSVFTHLSEEAATAALRAVRKVIKSDGLYVLTIRPIEFWRLPWGTATPEQIIQAEADHKNHGFAFLPHSWSDGSYGDASIDLKFFNREGWEMLEYDTSTLDPYQLSVILRPV
ncbi:class I SAM-dependent methyltransferase [Phyllobacterium sp. LjRoot231]|uniref:class I SAM-dependent methyltransferase n=1 Tax=Phyllobacterium sp. LjRoot231 TaxID=3342289 RepID=UPI003ED04ED0